jgi:hypothetical protein
MPANLAGHYRISQAKCEEALEMFVSGHQMRQKTKKKQAKPSFDALLAL